MIKIIKINLYNLFANDHKIQPVGGKKVQWFYDMLIGKRKNIARGNMTSKDSNSTHISQLNQFYKQLHYLPRVLNWVWKAAPGPTVIWAVVLLLESVLPVASVFLMREFVNAIFAAGTDGFFSSWTEVILLGGAQGTLLLLTQLLSSIQDWITMMQREKVNLYITTMVYKTTTQLDLSYFESANYYDQLRRATFEGRNAPIVLLSQMGSFVQYAIILIGMGGLLTSYGWWLPALLLLSGFPEALNAFFNNQRRNRWRKENTHNQRRLFYYDWLLTMQHFAAEIRIYQMAEEKIAAYRELQQRLSAERLNLEKIVLITTQITMVVSMLVLGGVGVWAILGSISGMLMIGDLAMFWQAAQKGRTTFSSTLSSLSQIYRNMLYLQDLCDLLDNRSTIQAPPFPKKFPATIKEGLTIENLSFHYPAKKELVIKGLNLELPAKKITALVGANGAGKSTLIKLLFRFYDPVNGQIRLDGVDIRDIGLLEYRQHLSVLMQFPAQFYTTVEKNIAVNPANGDHEALEKAAQAAGADSFIQKLPHKYDTMLGNMFDGTDLSGGEWLRIALARAFYRQSSFFLLDEPTEGMDSWAEMDWFRHFRTIAQDKISLIITHRFTTAMQADIIHLMHEGKIIESGSHEELVQLNGRYAKSWNEQLRLGKLAS